MSNYVTTKAECQSKILPDRVCERCGRKPIPMETVDNAGRPTFWAGCYHGSKGESAWGNYTNGVDKELYKLAKNIVLNEELYLVESMYNADFYDDWFSENVSRVCSILRSIEFAKNNTLQTKTEQRKKFAQTQKRKKATS